MPTVYGETWDTALNGIDNANVARVTDPVFGGLGALRGQPSASVSYWTADAVGTDPSVLVMRAYVRFPSLPAIDLDILRGSVDGVTFGSIRFDTSESKFGTALDDVLAAAGGPTIVVDTWYRVALRVDASTGTWTVDGQVAEGLGEATALTQSSGAFTSSTFSTYKLIDDDTVGTYTVYLDELVVSHTSVDHPISPDSGFVAATVATESADGNVAWTNPGNAAADDGNNASVTLTTGQSSNFIIAINENGGLVPDGATIHGIEVQFDRDFSGVQLGLNAYLTKGGVTLESDGKNVDAGTGLIVAGGPNDLWGTTWTAAEVNAATFGTMFNFGAGANGTGTVDAVWLRVFYTEAAGEPQTSYFYRRRSVAR